MTPTEEQLRETVDMLTSDEAGIVAHLRKEGHSTDEIKSWVETGAFDELGVRDGFLRALEPKLVKPQIKIPGFLEGDFGKAFLEEYQGRARADYNGNSALNVLKYNGKIVKGSNPFAVVLANQILREQGLKTASQADLERALRTGTLNLWGTYEDTGLVLRTEEEPNVYLAKDLMRQVKARNKESKMPVMIPLMGLELKVDSNSPFGLIFNLTDCSELIYAPILAGENHRKSFSETTEKTGLPNKLETGNSRTLYTRAGGLSGLCLDGDLSLASDGSDLADSGDNGRVVVVSAEGTSPENTGAKNED
jgi:hypothetical protein